MLGNCESQRVDISKKERGTNSANSQRAERGESPSALACHRPLLTTKEHFPVQCKGGTQGCELSEDDADVEALTVECLQVLEILKERDCRMLF